MISEALEQQERIAAGLEGKIAMPGPYGLDQGTVTIIQQTLLVAARRAEPYYFSTAICGLVASAARSLPDAILTRDLVPRDVGFWWFAEPLPIVRPGGPYEIEGMPVTGVRAMSWTTNYELAGGSFVPSDASLVAGEQPPSEGHYIPIDADGPIGRTATKLYLSVYMQVGPGVSPLTNLPMRFDVPWETSAAQSSLSGRSVEDEIESVAVRRQKVAQFMAALCFIRQRVLSTTRERADRAARRRLNRPDRDIQVVYLRRAHATPGETQFSDAVAWSCRWWVAGHWRQQPCGEARIERRPTWINPYVKGPEDKPMSTKKRLFAVVR